MSLISIVVPVYNRENFLEKCLKSIMNQTYKNIEIICVDDGSTDNSLNVLNDYAKLDNRIVVLKKENGGPNSARKYGVQRASGKYVAFVDSDDWIDLDMYESMMSAVPTNIRGTDSLHDIGLISCGNCIEGHYQTETFDDVDYPIYDKSNIYLLREKAFYNLKDKCPGVRGTIGNKLFLKNSLLNVLESMPDNLCVAEDKLMAISYLLDCESAVFIKKPLYHWRINHNSISRAQKNNYLNDVQNTYNYLQHLYKHPNFTESMKLQSEIYMIHLLMNGINRALGFKTSNFLRIDPQWMDEILENAQIMFYGGGELAEQYKSQLRNIRKDVKIVKDMGFNIPSLQDFCGCDQVVIGIKNEGEANKVRNQLISIGIPEKNILWTPQPEFYWKYVEAAGITNLIKED